MRLFRDRVDAGRLLAAALQKWKQAPDTIVIALPRGGVVVGFEVAEALGLPLDIVAPRKIGAPFNPELAIGAVTETGEGILSEALVEELHVPASYIKEATEKEKQKAKWRLDTYRKGRPPRDVRVKTVILIDDGLATGATMRAAIKTVRSEKAKTIVIAVPVAPPQTLEKLRGQVDDIVCLSSPSAFYAVGQFYEIFDQTTDEEVISLLSQRYTKT